MKQKTAAVFGAGGFIGHHLVNRLMAEGYRVQGFDLKYPEFEYTKADEFFIWDLREQIESLYFDEIYQLAADMGGAGYIFTGEHDADVMHNSSMINLNLLESLRKNKHPYKTKIFFSSSACIYPAYNQEDENNPKCSESSAYPAAPDSEYGFEKLFSERLYMAYARNYGFDVRIARFHNIFGIQSCFNNGKEKFPAAITRKIAQAKDGDSIEVWGDGSQTRSFLNVRTCLDGVRRLMDSDFNEPVNIGSDEMISINELTKMVIDISGKDLTIKNIHSDALGVRGRNSDNALIKEKLGWAPSQNLKKEMTILYGWVNRQVWQ